MEQLTRQHMLLLSQLARASRLFFSACSESSLLRSELAALHVHGGGSGGQPQGPQGP